MRLSNWLIRAGLKVSIAGAIVSVTACSQPTSREELELFIKASFDRAPQRLQEAPEAPMLKRFVYSAAGLRSPFERPPALAAPRSISTGVAPDFSRTKEALESSPFSDLSMVGFLALGDELLALIENPEGEIFRVGVGNYLGLNHGRVWRVRREGIDLLEIVPSGDDGWIKRPQSLTMRPRVPSAR